MYQSEKVVSVNSKHPHKNRSVPTFGKRHILQTPPAYAIKPKVPRLQSSHLSSRDHKERCSQVSDNYHEPQLTICLLARRRIRTYDWVITAIADRDLVEHERAALPAPALAEVEAVGCAFVDTEHPAALGGTVDLEVRLDRWAAVDVGRERGYEGACLALRSDGK